MVVYGDAKDGAALHKVRVHELRDKKVLITREAGTGCDQVNPQDPRPELQPRQFAEITPDHNIELNSDESLTECPKDRKHGPLSPFSDDNPEGEGSGDASLYRMDSDFPPEGVHDMVLMKQLNNAELARNLLTKFRAKTGYVRCGPTLVALNMMASYNTPDFPDGPFDRGLFERFYNMTNRASESPHPWSLASACFQTAFQPHNAVHVNDNQAMIITGESGAGKTFTTKQILDYLAWVGSDKGANPDLAALTDKMLTTTPILEGLGNSNMPRNPDSSRFGKLYKIYFNKQTKMMTGCAITPYMLEKSRVSSQQQGERNFHMFYRMLCEPVDIMDFRKIQGDDKKAEKMLRKECTVAETALSSQGKPTYFEEGGKKFLGLSPEKRAMCKLPPAGVAGMESFVYLKGGTKMLNVAYDRIYKDIPEENRDFDDAFNMSNMLASFHNFFTDEEIDMMLKTISGVLWLGNVEIEGDGVECTGVVRGGASGAALKTTAELWQVDEDLLAKACFMVTMNIGQGKTKQVPCPANYGGFSGALSLRDGVARFVYDKLFMWVIEKCSTLLAAGADPDRNLFLGVLDIFGFEFYENHKIEAVDAKVVNGLDQLNINICNELLQQQFVQVIFGLEKATYKEQGYTFAFDDYDDNKPACEFLTELSGPLLKALAEPAHNKVFGKKADNLFLKTLKSRGKNATAATAAAIDPKTTVLLGFPTKGFGSAFNGQHGGQYGSYGEKGRAGANWKAQVENISRDFDEKGADNGSPAFGIHHYAADVAYDCRGWLQKDNSSPSDEMAACLSQSSDQSFMAPVFGAPPDASSGGVTQQFSTSLGKLLATLATCDMNFVRCLKTSNPLSRGTFQSSLVLKQLQYTGMLDTLNIRRFGFPQRMTPQEFVDMYKLLAPSVSLPAYSDTGEAPPLSAVIGAAEATAKFMHKEYVERVFGELPPSDRADKKMIAQKGETIVVGKPTKSSVAPLVMMRDWFQRGTQKIAFEQLRVFADTAIVGLQKKYYCESFKNKRESLKLFAPRLRALAQRAPYLTTKWRTLDDQGKQKLSVQLRAHVARVEYSLKRNEHYEARMKQAICGSMLATVQRQYFYEEKMRYLEKVKIDQETRKMRAMEVVSSEFMVDLCEEQEKAACRKKQMREEENHAEEVALAIEMAKGNLIKERCMLAASYCRQKASDAVQRVKEIEIQGLKHTKMLKMHSKAISEALLQKCLKRLKAMNLITGKSLTLDPHVVDQELETVVKQMVSEGASPDEIEEAIPEQRQKIEEKNLLKLVQQRHPGLMKLPADHDEDGLRSYFAARARRIANHRTAEAVFTVDGGPSQIDLTQFDSIQQAKMAVAVVHSLKGLGLKKLDLASVEVNLSANSAPDPTPRMNPGRPYPAGGFGKPFVHPSQN